MDNTNNKQYWNDYVTYWENRVKETNENKEIKDKTSSDAILEMYYKKLQVNKEDVFLDYGCGSGRLFSIYNKEFKGRNNYFGIDISGICLEHATQEYNGLEIGKNLKEFNGINIPFDDCTFDKIICFGVFDACNQEMVISELFRVLKGAGMLLVTGKNDTYFEDDDGARVAEVNARKKGHPNYFTDVHNLKKQLSAHNVEILEEYYFLRRGDFPNNKCTSILTEKFYEWAYILKKENNYRNYEYQKFSNKYSRIERK